MVFFFLLLDLTEPDDDDLREEHSRRIEDAVSPLVPEVDFREERRLEATAASSLPSTVLLERLELLPSPFLDLEASMDRRARLELPSPSAVLLPRLELVSTFVERVLRMDDTMSLCSEEDKVFLRPLKEGDSIVSSAAIAPLIVVVVKAPMLALLRVLGLLFLFFSSPSN